MHVARIAWEGDAIHHASAPSSSLPPQVHVGCSGWFYWHWRGPHLPGPPARTSGSTTTPTRSKPSNLTPRSTPGPRAATVADLASAGGRRKVRLRGEGQRADYAREAVRRHQDAGRDFGHVADLLGDASAASSSSFRPASTHTRPPEPDRRPARPRPPNVVEFRHRSWWNESVYTAFRDADADVLLVQRPAPAGRAGRTQRTTSTSASTAQAVVSARLHRAELAVWSERIHASGAKHVWAYFNNDRDGYAIKNARALRRLLRR